MTFLLPKPFWSNNKFLEFIQACFFNFQSPSALSYKLFTCHNPVSSALVKAICAYACVNFESAPVLAYNNNTVPKRQTLRGCYCYTGSAAAEFSFGTSSTAVTRLKVFPWRAAAWILACQCVATFLSVVTVASPLTVLSWIKSK